MKRVQIAAKAYDDADEIADYIARDNPDRAQSFRAELLATARRIGENPRRYRLRPEYGQDVCAAAHGVYLIVFAEADIFVRVLRIVHGARNPRKAMR